MKIKYSGNYTVGETRKITKFLLIPRFMGGVFRWLEKAVIKQEYKKYWYGNFWHNENWAG